MPAQAGGASCLEIAKSVAHEDMSAGGESLDHAAALRLTLTFFVATMGPLILLWSMTHER